MDNLDKRISGAVRHFWLTRTRQTRNQGERTGRRDSGNRTASTGGKQLDGFNHLIRDLLLEAGIPQSIIHTNGRENVTLPGFFRPTKQWDLVVVFEGNLLVSIECKALCGPSFGNNFNNRIEEALGSSTDLWTAYREGVLDKSLKPFLGYVLFLEDAAGSTKPVNVLEKHFRVSEEFCGASYVGRCEESLRRLMRERCYDATALICSQKKSGSRGVFNEPSKDLSFRRFAKLMTGQVVASYNAIKDDID